MSIAEIANSTFYGALQILKFAAGIILGLVMTVAFLVGCGALILVLFKLISH